MFTKYDISNPVTERMKVKDRYHRNSVCVLKTYACTKVTNFCYLSDSNEVIVCKTGNLTNLELLKLYNKHITPLASAEEPETVAPKTKSEKKASKKR
jgi:hypothetical protein